MSNQLNSVCNSQKKSLKRKERFDIDSHTKRSEEQRKKWKELKRVKKKEDIIDRNRATEKE